jgi:type IV secretion system protein VirB4
VDEERRAAFEESGHHFESSYHLTLAYLPPEESRARAAKLLYENAPGDGVDWRGRLTPSWQKRIGFSTCSMA